MHCGAQYSVLLGGQWSLIHQIFILSPSSVPALCWGHSGDPDNPGPALLGLPVQRGRQICLQRVKTQSEQGWGAQKGDLPCLVREGALGKVNNMCKDRVGGRAICGGSFVLALPCPSCRWLAKGADRR